MHVGDFGIPGARAGRFGSQLSVFVVGTKANAFDEGTFSVVIFFPVKEIVHEITGALGRIEMKVVAQRTAGVKVRRVVLGSKEERSQGELKGKKKKKS